MNFDCEHHLFLLSKSEKFPAPIKAKLEVFLQKDPKIPGAHKIGAAISGPRIAGRKTTDIRLVLILDWRSESLVRKPVFPF